MFPEPGKIRESSEYFLERKTHWKILVFYFTVNRSNMLFLREKTCDMQYVYSVSKAVLPCKPPYYREKNKDIYLKSLMHLTSRAATPNVSFLLSNGFSAFKLNSCTFHVLLS